MSYKPSEQDIIAYLYGELEGSSKDNVEQYLLQHPEARKEMEQLKSVSHILKNVKDKEVIAPPIVVNDHDQSRFWNTPYIRTIISIAASLIIIILVGRFSGLRITSSDGELRIGFGTGEKSNSVPEKNTVSSEALLTATEVQTMIDQSLQQHDDVVKADWQKSQHELNASIRHNLADNSEKIDRLVREASLASQEQIRLYVSTMQNENLQLVKDYFKLTAGEQKQYIETLLVDFAKYLQQQRKDDMVLVQSRLNSLEQNTNVFRQETEQILTNIISTVGTGKAKETKY
jgi:hypothetical protein